MRSARVAARRLELVSAAQRQSERLVIGDRVRLNSGGPVGLVVDTDDSNQITVAWGRQEVTFPSICFLRSF
jgi:preprotein translocase subunit YajC